MEEEEEKKNTSTVDRTSISSKRGEKGESDDWLIRRRITRSRFVSLVSPILLPSVNICYIYPCHLSNETKNVFYSKIKRRPFQVEKKIQVIICKL